MRGPYNDPQERTFSSEQGVGVFPRRLPTIERSKTLRIQMCTVDNCARNVHRKQLNDAEMLRRQDGAPNYTHRQHSTRHYRRIRQLFAAVVPSLPCSRSGRGHGLVVADQSRHATLNVVDRIPRVWPTDCGWLAAQCPPRHATPRRASIPSLTARLQ